MKKILCFHLILTLFIVSPIYGQTETELNKLLRSDKDVPQVLLVGTFHFGYPGLDSHKTGDEYKVDIKSPQRQKEVEELVAYIAKFKPTKIMVETGKNTGYLVKRFEKWKAGNEELKKREVEQIGFRLMDQFELDTLFGIDASSFVRELSRSKDSSIAQPILDQIYQSVPDSLFETEFDAKYWEWYDLQDKRCVEMNLLDYFLECNSPHHINRMHGHYILSDKTKDYNTIDGMTLNWYSRNLRIFKNIQMVDTDSSDRIMILIGSGHVTILQQLFECSPEYEIVKFGDL